MHHSSHCNGLFLLFFLFPQRQVELPAGFPSREVWSAYHCPEVDESREELQWGRPDLDLIRKYPMLYIAHSWAYPILYSIYSSQTAMPHAIYSCVGQARGPSLLCCCP